jgi:hypothetical protein
MDAGAEPESSGLGTQRILALVVGGVGLVGVGAGAIFGLKAKSTWADAEERCPEARCNTAADLELDDDARSSAMVSTVAFAAGGAALAGGVVLWLTAPSAKVSSSEHSN